MAEEMTPYQRALADLEERAREVERLRKEEIAQVVDDIKNKMRLYNLTIKDLGYDFPVGGDTKDRGTKDGRSSVVPKYRGPNGEEWAGRGKTPGWLTKLIAEGRSIDEFLIKKDDS